MRNTGDGGQPEPESPTVCSLMRADGSGGPRGEQGKELIAAIEATLPVRKTEGCYHVQILKDVHLASFDLLEIPANAHSRNGRKDLRGVPNRLIPPGQAVGVTGQPGSPPVHWARWRGGGSSARMVRRKNAVRPRGQQDRHGPQHSVRSHRVHHSALHVGVLCQRAEGAPNVGREQQKAIVAKPRKTELL